MAYENYTIKQFLDALYKNKRDVINEEEFKIVYTEYIDTAGLYETEQFNKVTYIHYLSNRINSIKLSIKLQKEFLKEFNVPFIRELVFFKKFGHILSWKTSLPVDIAIKDFLMQLEKIELKENKYITKLEEASKSLKELKEKSVKKVLSTEQNRGNFIKTINSLRKIGHTIKMDETTVEELAWIIREESKNN